MKKVLTICLSPVIQKTLIFKNITIGSVNRTNEYYKSISGKGINVSRALRNKGVSIQHLTQLGGYSKKWFLQQAKKEGLKISWVNSYSEIRNCYTLLDSPKETTELVEETPKVHKKTNKKLISKMKSIVKKNDIIVISGSKAKGYSDNIIPGIVKIAKANKKCIVLDIVGEDLRRSLQYNPDYIKINKDEFYETFNDSFSNVSKELKKNGTTIIITDGINEILYRNDLEVKKYTPNINNSPVNTTGCGDTFCAGMVYSLINNGSIDDLIKTGAKWGYLNSMTIIPGDVK